MKLSVLFIFALVGCGLAVMAEEDVEDEAPTELEDPGIYIPWHKKPCPPSRCSGWCKHGLKRRFKIRGCLVCVCSAYKRGLRGLRGLRGPRGYRGLRGNRGSRGYRGFTGSRGNRGMRGLRGAKGQRGMRGNRGPRGPTGQRGLTGSRGPRGRRGRPGILQCRMYTRVHATIVGCPRGTFATGCSCGSRMYKIWNNRCYCKPSYGRSTKLGAVCCRSV